MVSQLFFSKPKKAKKTTKSRMSKEKPDKKYERDLGLNFQKTKKKWKTKTRMHELLF